MSGNKNIECAPNQSQSRSGFLEQEDCIKLEGQFVYQLDFEQVNFSSHFSLPFCHLACRICLGGHMVAESCIKICSTSDQERPYALPRGRWKWDWKLIVCLTWLYEHHPPRSFFSEKTPVQ
jgi:hypothetical protein